LWKCRCNTLSSPPSLAERGAATAASMGGGAGEDPLKMEDGRLR
jgi:hypothetical protein